MYARLGSIGRVAAEVGVCPRTMRYWFRDLNIHGTMSRPRKRTSKYASEVEKWLKEHPKEVLPKSVSKAAKVMGLSRVSLATWLSRRKATIAKYVGELGDLRNRDVVEHAVNANTGAPMLVPPKAIANYGIVIDQWTLDVTYRGNLKVGTPFAFTVKFGNLKRFWKKED